MPDYSKTIIYKLCCNDTNITDIYIGSTCNFSRRKNCHKSDCNNESRNSYNLKVYQFIRDNGNFENWSMIQLEEKSVENKREKEALEREWIEKLKPSLNIQLPTRSRKEWVNDNMEYVKEKCKEKYIQNKEKILEKRKEYREKNKDKLKEQKKKYREENKDKIKEKFNCECGGKYTHHHKSQHFKTKRHQTFIASLDA